MQTEKNPNPRRWGDVYQRAVTSGLLASKGVHGSLVGVAGRAVMETQPSPLTTH